MEYGNQHLAEPKTTIERRYSTNYNFSLSKFSELMSLFILDSLLSIYWFVPSAVAESGKRSRTESRGATSAIRTYYSTAREKGDRRVLLRRVGWFAVYVVSFFIIFSALPDLLYTAHHQYEARARVALHKISSAQETYARTYPQGFSPTLAALGPPPSGAAPSATAAGLIEAALTQVGSRGCARTGRTGSA